MKSLRKDTFWDAFLIPIHSTTTVTPPHTFRDQINDLLHIL